MEWKGIAASSGYAIGTAYVLAEMEHKVSRRELADNEIEGEIVRFEEKVELAVKDIRALQSNAASACREEQVGIFATHLSLLRDPEYTGEVKERIRANSLCAEAALDDVTEELIEVFSGMDNEVLRERCMDLRDIRARVLSHLSGAPRADGLDIDFGEPVIVIGKDITPSATARLNRDDVLGFAVETGGRTSHSAIIARSLGIPAVVGLTGLTSGVQSGDLVLLDGHEGCLRVHPSPELVEEYRERQRAAAEQASVYERFKSLPTVTSDGRAVQLAINIAAPHEAAVAGKCGAEGIGLFRSEFLFMNRAGSPGEEEQYQAYKTAVLAVSEGDPVIIRSLDVGGDKEIPYLRQSREDNPFLGYRAIRLCLSLEYRAMFKTQLRAILRASAHGNVKLMYPMISTLQELREANALLAEARSDLDALGVLYNESMEVGVMIEVPAAALIADQLAKEAHFFSIGTNDLVQYTMAADRMNEQVAYLSQPMNPAILRLIDRVIEAAHQAGIWVGMCGEMAGQPTAIPVLLGLGLDEFSMSPSMVLPARELISRLSFAEMQSLARQALQMESAEEIESYVLERTGI